MPLSNRAICVILFQEETPGKFVRNSCSRTYRSAQGFINLINNLRRFHPSYEAEAETALRETNALRLHIVDARTNEIFRWVLLVVMERLPFSFCERQLVRQSTKMTNISEKTLTRYIMLLHQHVDGRNVEVLPLKFGIVLDGWIVTTWYFAVFDNNKLNGVTQTLQKSTLTLSGVRRLFDHVLAEYPQLDARLGTAAIIINN
ncbi:hypothetical protein JG688_00015316 [Phytophthora aleatoria]|uniref:Uncharacterized protein n=1 Tax=Phytophthora aleatoria TaxID=2496075 RepID=A0A8J5M2S1_9STRA|nr:hypothetical protein JG688_00015316 [Phytophthora aleatoria]